MLEESAREKIELLTDEIIIKLRRKHMSQVELGKMIDESPVQLNRAIHGDMTPKSVKIRKKIYKVLDM
ncbi:transcriptional regulator [Fructilactobacillus vespulae]|uniref:transcriptional regulator n=1 Tax=Fructilactobacillus vespulae TaxID=1249630 RepID=UPI0039B695C7